MRRPSPSLLYLFFDGLTPLYVISALFGLFQGGIVPMYAIIVREYFDPRQSGTLVGLVIMSTILGMALGGWMSGAIFDATGSYWQAFANGFLWNLSTSPSCCSSWRAARTARGTPEPTDLDGPTWTCTRLQARPIREARFRRDAAFPFW